MASVGPLRVQEADQLYLVRKLVGVEVGEKPLARVGDVPAIFPTDPDLDVFDDLKRQLLQQPQESRRLRRVWPKTTGRL